MFREPPLSGGHGSSELITAFQGKKYVIFLTFRDLSGILSPGGNLTMHFRTQLWERAPVCALGILLTVLTYLAFVISGLLALTVVTGAVLGFTASRRSGPVARSIVQSHDYPCPAKEMIPLKPLMTPAQQRFAAAFDLRYEPRYGTYPNSKLRAALYDAFGRDVESGEVDAHAVCDRLTRVYWLSFCDRESLVREISQL